MEKKEELMEIYKIHCDLADKVSQRRGQTNQFYITVLSALMVILPLTSSNNMKLNTGVVCISIGLFGLLLCCLWMLNIVSYRQLNSGKFQVLHELENQLSFQFYAKEWEYLGQGKNRKKYLQLTRVEKYVPILIASPFAVLIVYGLIIA